MSWEQSKWWAVCLYMWQNAPKPHKIPNNNNNNHTHKSNMNSIPSDIQRSGHGYVKKGVPLRSFNVLETVFRRCLCSTWIKYMHANCTIVVIYRVNQRVEATKGGREWESQRVPSNSSQSATLVAVSHSSCPRKWKCASFISMTLSCTLWHLLEFWISIAFP